MAPFNTRVFVLALFLPGFFAQHSNVGNYALSFGNANGYSFGNKGYSAPFAGGFKSFLGRVKGVPYATVKGQDKLKLVGRTVITPPLDYDKIPKIHGLAATISETSNVVNNSPLGDWWYNTQSQLGGKGLSLKLEVQTSTPGYYHVVLTSRARVNEGCSKDTLGDLLEYSHMSTNSLFSLYGVLTSSHLPDGVIADIELGRNVPKMLHINRLKNFNHIEDLAGRGIAICQTNGKSNRQRSPCSGAIVACTDLTYSDHDVSLGYLEPPQYRPEPPRDLPTRPLPPPRSAEDLPPDEYYSQRHEPRPYFDLDNQPYYDEENEMLSTYSPPPPPPEPDYDPYNIHDNREPITDRAILYGTMANNYQPYRSDREFGIGQRLPGF